MDGETLKGCFNGSYGSKSGCADQYIYMVWRGEWTLAEQKHYQVAFWAAINLSASGDQCPNAFLIGFHGVSISMKYSELSSGSSDEVLPWNSMLENWLLRACQSLLRGWYSMEALTMSTLNKVLVEQQQALQRRQRLKKHECKHRLKKKMFWNKSVRLKQR